jgi:hypothetical protein
MITGTYNLLADPSWSLLQLNVVRLECDTTAGPVTINLPAISTLAQSTNLKLLIVDATANASVNNITINAGTTGAPPVSDTFDDDTTTALILDANGSSVSIQNLTSTQWLAVESVGGLTQNYDLIQGNPGLGGDSRVQSGFQKISDTATVSSVTNGLYKLKAILDFDGSANVYAHYIGLITVDLGATLEIAANDSVFNCTDTGLAGTIDSVLANYAWVTNSGTGVSEQIPFVVFNPDNTPGNPNEYYIYLLTGNPNNFSGTGYLDITFLTNSTTVTYTQNI